jgi:carbamate kinase
MISSCGGVPRVREAVDRAAIEAVVDHDHTAAPGLVVTDVPAACTEVASRWRPPLGQVMATRLRDLLAEGRVTLGTRVTKFEARGRFKCAAAWRAARSIDRTAAAPSAPPTTRTFTARAPP